MGRKPRAGKGFEHRRQGRVRTTSVVELEYGVGEPVVSGRKRQDPAPTHSVVDGLAATDTKHLGYLLRSEQRTEMATPDGASDGEKRRPPAKRAGVADIRVMLVDAKLCEGLLKGDHGGAPCHDLMVARQGRQVKIVKELLGVQPPVDDRRANENSQSRAASQERAEGDGVLAGSQP